MLDDEDKKIARPRQVYLGPRKQAYVPLEKRDGKTKFAV
jgi:citrate synthase